MIILETERLLLRRFVQDDLDDIYRLLFADEEVKSTWSGRTGTEVEIKAGFAKEHIEPMDELSLQALVRKDDDAFIGLMGFQRHLPDEDHPYLQSAEAPNRTISNDPTVIETELTYALGRPYWKQGYAVEMGRAMITYGFETLGISRIIQGVLGHNTNSINLMRRLGFRIEKQLNTDNVVGIFDDYLPVTYKRDLDGVDWAEMKATLHVDDFDNGRTPEQLRISFENSAATCIAYIDGRIIGTVRVLSDGICNAYVVDVWTLTQYRRRGIATQMMERLLLDLQGQHVYLFSDDRVDFYHSLGFEERPVGLQKVIGQWLVNG